MSSKSVSSKTDIKDEEYSPIDVKLLNKTLRKRGGELIPSNGSLRVNTDIEVPQVKENQTFKQFIEHLQLNEDTRSRSAEELSVGDYVEITGDVSHKGEMGTITHFSKDKRFVVVELDDDEYSFHSSDVTEADHVVEAPDNRVRTAPKEFSVAVYNNNTRKAWVGIVSKEAGGKWHEQPGFGGHDKRWGNTYSSSYTADEVYDEIVKSFPRQFEIEGPFDSALQALDHCRREWGSEKEEIKTETVAVNDRSMKKYTIVLTSAEYADWKDKGRGGMFVHKYNRTSGELTVETAKPYQLAASLEKSIDFGATTAEEVLGLDHSFSETEEAKSAKAAFVPGETVHLGFGAKGGAGFKGTLKKIGDDEAEIESDTVGRFGKKTFKGPSRFLSKEVEENSDKPGFKDHVEDNRIKEKIKAIATNLLGTEAISIGFDALSPSTLTHAKEINHKFVDTKNGNWIVKSYDYRALKFVLAIPPKESNQEEMLFAPSNETDE